MKAKEIKLLLHTADLFKSQAFYSALGITWGCGEDLKFGKSGLPENVEQHSELSSLPHLWGDLGATEFIFYLEKGRAVEIKPSTIFMVYFEDQTAVDLVILRLKDLGLFVKAEGFDPKFRRLVVDPDGRYIELCSPNPFRV